MSSFASSSRSASSSTASPANIGSDTSRPSRPFKIKLDGADIRCRNCKAIKNQCEKIFRAQEAEINFLNEVNDKKQERLQSLNSRLDQANDAKITKDKRIRELECLLRNRDEKIITLQDELRQKLSEAPVKKDKQKGKMKEEGGGVEIDNYSAKESLSRLASSIFDTFETPLDEWLSPNKYHYQKEKIPENYPIRQDTNSKFGVFQPKLHNRVHIGAVSPEITKIRLKECLEAAIGRVLEIDILRAKKCAFVEFADHGTYIEALNQGCVHLDQQVLHINTVRLRTSVMKP